ncbi:MAG: hypothetical protein RI897_2366 [Verrucomicrobiota bacterium]
MGWWTRGSVEPREYRVPTSARLVKGIWLSQIRRIPSSLVELRRTGGASVQVGASGEGRWGQGAKREAFGASVESRAAGAAQGGSPLIGAGCTS